ncbi:MAG: LTA synthase family protein [Erysipelotrichaceae bacterium]|nr:LTA synthase family protein [Erysipelotrichaceae bacterium]
MKNNRLLYLGGVLFFIDTILVGLFSYLNKYINVDITAYIYTFFREKTGTSKDVITHAVKNMIPFIILAVVIPVFLIILFNRNKISFKIEFGRKNKKKHVIDGITLFGRCFLILCILIMFFTLRRIDKTYSIYDDYIRQRSQPTYIYDEYYVNPNDVEIQGENTNNLILIYLESIETTFMSKEDGGGMDYELLPNLRNLAENNINFSATEGIGGFNSPSGTTWTMGALFASESGLPFMFPIDGNQMGTDLAFASKVPTLGDILKEKNYNLEFLCGSDATFAGRSSFYKTHGDFTIFDYYTAVEKGYTDEYVWWGFDDELLYKIAKDELNTLSHEEDPFCFVMLTVDTHHIGGYVCDLCRNEYDNQYANVVSCADRQIFEFVEWLKEQDFYENTTIVIVGDHPTMDATLISSNLAGSNRIEDRKNNDINSNDGRYVYDCFINSRVSTENIKNREFNTLDLFPTILASMGFEIEGERLGLGTNLFSQETTLQEEYDYYYLNDEFSKYSEYCRENFW